MLPPVSVVIASRESVDYIADTTLRLLFVRVTLFAFHFQIRVVVINSQVNPRHVTVPVNPSCAVLSLNTSLMSQSVNVFHYLPISPTLRNLRRVS